MWLGSAVSVPQVIPEAQRSPLMSALFLHVPDAGGRNAPKSRRVDACDLTGRRGRTLMQHGMQKLFGWFGGVGAGATVPIMSQMGLAGILELGGGALLILGLLTRPTAAVLIIEMFVAYFQAHAPQGWLANSEPGRAGTSLCGDFRVPGRQRRRCVQSRQLGDAASSTRSAPRHRSA